MPAMTIALLFVAMVGLSALELWLFWRLGRTRRTPSSGLPRQGPPPDGELEAQ